MTDMMNVRDPNVLRLERLSDPSLGAARMETFGKSLQASGSPPIGSLMLIFVDQT